MRIIIAPAAFKHSLGAPAVADAIARGLARALPNADLIRLPIADGGNGTLEAFLATGGTRVELTVSGPFGAPVSAAYGIIESDGHPPTAVIEMALASGIELVTEPDPLRASTYGTGQLLQSALEAGARRFIIGMGGSATVDGGAGCLQALGVRLLTADGRDIPPGGGGLAQLNRIDATGRDPRWRECEVIIASDVDNPVLGEHGAAEVFGPQKGATPDMIPVLSANLDRLFALTHSTLGVDVRHTPGAGAAGALAGALMAYLGGRIQSGIDLVLAHNRFEALLPTAALVVTGEGQMDDQTVHGKGPVGVARLAQAHGVPTVAIVGGLNTTDDRLHDAGIQAVIPIVTRPMPLADAIASAPDLIERAALRLGYLLSLSLPTR